MYLSVVIPTFNRHDVLRLCLRSIAAQQGVEQGEVEVLVLNDIRLEVEDATKEVAQIDHLVIHRHGPLSPGEPIMMVATAARHRGAAFEAAEFLMDYLKSRAPFWKKEFGTDGAEWVASKDEDEAALKRWRD